VLMTEDALRLDELEEDELEVGELKEDGTMF
jgi:hypothetical protein